MDEPNNAAVGKVAVLVLEMLGLVLLAVGAGLIYPVAGLIVVGLGCVLLGWRLDRDGRRRSVGG